MKTLARATGTILMVSILLSMVSCGSPKGTELKDCKVFHETEFGAIAIDISIEDFKNLGFEFGDAMELVFSNGKKEVDIPFYSGYFVRPGDYLVVGYPGYETIRFCCNSGDDPWITHNINDGDTVTIRLTGKGKYLSVQNALDLSYTKERSDYSSDREFANYREVKAGGIKEGLIYRSASPVDNKYKRAPFVDDLMEEDRINYVVNLADTEEKIKTYMDSDDYASDYFKGIFDQEKYCLIKMNMNYKSDAFAQKMADIIRNMTKEEGPYLIHCQEGKDRTGFVCLIIEALAGARYEEIENDYMITYANYYKITEDKDRNKYDMIVSQYLGGMIDTLAEGDVTDPHAVDLEEGARRYLKNAGMTDGEIDAFVDKITE